MHAQALIALSLAGQNPPAYEQALQVLAAAEEEGRAYIECVSAAAVKLGTGNSEPARDIVEAAKRRCDFTKTKTMLLDVMRSGYAMQRVDILLVTIPAEAEDNAVAALIEARVGE